MKKYTLIERSQVDSRGLPNGMDPRKFYEYSLLSRAKSASGLEGLLYKYMPHSLIQSFAFAIDPLSNYKTSLAAVSPVTRTRIRELNSVLSGSAMSIYWFRQTSGTIPNWDCVGCNSPFIVTYPPTIDKDTSQFKAQAPALNQRRDTTGKTRPIGSSLGEFELFKSSINSPPRQNTGKANSDISINFGAFRTQRAKFKNEYTVSWGPQAATISSQNMNTIKDQELATCNSLISSNILGMIGKVNPLARNYTLFRNVVELRDIPRSIVSLKRTAEELITLGRTLNVQKYSQIVHDLRSISKRIPDEYLSYSFGWRQLYSDVMGLLNAPAKISSQINLLIERNGKDTSFRTKKEVLLPSANGFPGFEYRGNFFNDKNERTSTRSQRKAELRLVVNTNFSFPKADLPRFKRKLFAEKLGVSPTLTDLYNLVPWSWLLDWFTGFGNYVSIMEQVNSDKRIINWGLITCELTGSVITDYFSETEDKFNLSIDFVDSETKRLIANNHSSSFDYKAIVRKSVSSATSGLNIISDPSSLTTYQKSILGALISQRTNYRR